jgi:hypothetical protein
MLEESSPKFRIFFLQKFTKELIEHSIGKDIFNIKRAISKKIREYDYKTKEFSNQIKEKVKNPNLRRIPTMMNPPTRNLPPKIHREPLYLKIPQTKISPDLEYLKPVPTSEEINFEKLAPLVKDTKVELIECPGPNKNVIVSGNMGVKKSNIILNKEEIDNVIEKFSSKARIPVARGAFKVAVGNIVFSAIISDITGSKFIINKIK